jgi:methylase of polypeptide subunit release factors
MYTTLLPELRPYLERLLEDTLAQTDMTIRQQATRERMLCMLQKELVSFIFIELMEALPPHARNKFATLLEQGASEETLAAITTLHIDDIPAFVVQVFEHFRERFVPSREPTIN